MIQPAAVGERTVRVANDKHPSHSGSLQLRPPGGSDGVTLVSPTAAREDADHEPRVGSRVARRRWGAAGV